VLPDHVRNRTLYTLGLADSLLSEREVERAAAHATAGLELAGGLREGVRRGRVARRLRQLRGRFGQWPDVPEARAWAAAYDSACSPDPARPRAAVLAGRAGHTGPALAVSR
jgi:hypothetical protein